MNKVGGPVVESRIHWLHSEVSLGKILHPKLPLMAVPLVCEWICEWQSKEISCRPLDR